MMGEQCSSISYVRLVGKNGAPTRPVGGHAARAATSAFTYQRRPAKRPSRSRISSSTTSPVAGFRGSDVTHGTRSGYNNGCRCPSCTEANTAASRAHRERIAGRSGSGRTPKARLTHMPTAARMTTPLPVVVPTPKTAQLYRSVSLVEHRPDLFSGTTKPVRTRPRSLARPIARRQQRADRFGWTPSNFLRADRFKIRQKATTQAQEAAVIDDYYRRSSLYRSGMVDESPDLQDLRTAYGR
jgi:hypothetical protein